MSAPKAIKYCGQIYRQAVDSTALDHELYTPYLRRLQKLVDALTAIDKQMALQGSDSDARLFQAKVTQSLEMAQAQLNIAKTGLQKIIDGKFGRHTIAPGADRT